MRHRLERFFPNAGYYGWKIVVVGMFCSALSAPGQSFALSLYIEHLIADVGFTRVGLSSLYAGATLSAALVLPMLGAFADRTSARKFIVLGLLGIATAMLLLSQAQGFIAVAVALIALRLLGQGATALFITPPPSTVNEEDAEPGAYGRAARGGAMTVTAGCGVAPPR